MPATPVAETPAPQSEQKAEETPSQKEEEDEEKKKTEKEDETEGEKEPEKPAITIESEKPTDKLEVAAASSETELPPTSPLSSPAVHVEETTDLLGEIMENKESFDMPWDVAAGNRLSMQVSVSSDQTDDDEEFSLVCFTDYFPHFSSILLIFFLRIFFSRLRQIYICSDTNNGD